MFDIYGLLSKAIKETFRLVDLVDGEVFLLRVFFKGYEWIKIARSNRLLLGIQFHNNIKSEFLNAKVSDETYSGQQRYQICRREYYA